MNAKDLLNGTGEYYDVHIVDKGFNWTYVVPYVEEWSLYFKKSPRTIEKID